MSESANPSPRSAVIVRHGETAWSRLGRHTGVSDLPLSAEGEAQARRLAPSLSPLGLGAVWVSPRARAMRTCELAGLMGAAVQDPDLAEWDYGSFEGLVRGEIERISPGWDIFRDGCPGGESPLQVSARADRVIERVRSAPGDAALFTHGHFGRVLAVRWTGQGVSEGGRLVLGTATLGVLGYEHADKAHPAIALWNAPPGTWITL